MSWGATAIQVLAEEIEDLKEQLSKQMDITAFYRRRVDEESARADALSVELGRFRAWAEDTPNGSEKGAKDGE